VQELSKRPKLARVYIEHEGLRLELNDKKDKAVVA